MNSLKVEKHANETSQATVFPHPEHVFDHVLPRDFSDECGHVTLNHCHLMEIQANSNDQPIIA